MVCIVNLKRVPQFWWYSVSVHFIGFQGSNGGTPSSMPNATVVHNESRMSGVSPFHSAEHFVKSEDASLSYHTCEECSGSSCNHGNDCSSHCLRVSVNKENHLLTPSPLSRSRSLELENLSIWWCMFEVHHWWCTKIWGVIQTENSRLFYYH